MENYEKKINGHLMKGWLVMVLSLMAAYIGEYAKGQRTAGYVVCFSLSAVVPAVICYLFYRRDKEDRRLRYMILGGFFVMYAFALLTGRTVMIFSYILPMLSLIVLYHQPGLVLGMGVFSLAVNLLYDIRLLLAGEITLENSRDLEIQMVLLVLCFGFLYAASRVYDQIDRKNKEYVEALAAKQKQLQRVTLQTITTVANTIDAKDEYTQGHSRRVSEYAALIAGLLGRDESYIQNIKYIALLHDIGKIGIPDAILNKPGPLTDSEYQLMRQHTEIGSNILKDNGMIAGLADGVRHHHERYDGTGYPDGLKGKEISEISRIIGLADAYDAMTSNRVYRKRLSDEEVIAEIRRCSGTQFDPEIAAVFVKALQDKKVCQLSPDSYVHGDSLEEQSTLLLQNILELQNAQKSMKEQKDYLTGLYNRSIGEKKIEERLGNAGGCLLLIDIMNLREINSRYSFIGGDHLIKTVAEVLSEYGQQQDIVSRYDGDEFMYYTDRAAEQEQAEQLMAELLELVKKKIHRRREYEKVRICIGGAVTDVVGRDFSALLTAADKALYYMKQLKKEGGYLYRTADKKLYGEGQLSKADLEQLLKVISRDSEYKGTYNVNYPEFVKLYDFIKSVTDRNRQEVQLLLLTLIPSRPRKLEVTERDEGMLCMEGAVNSALRKVDIMLRINSTQCLVFLMNLPEEKVQLVVNRVMTNFLKSYSGEDMRLQYELADLKKAEQDS